MASKKKTVWILGLAIAALLAALVIVVPMLIDLDRYRPMAIAYLERDTGKPVSIRRLQLTLFPVLSVRADDVVIGNPPGFPPGDFINAKRVYAELKAGELWHRRVVIASLVLDRPAIALLTDGHGHWNSQNRAGEEPVRRTALVEAPEPFTLEAISKLEVRAARVTAARSLSSEAGGSAFFEASGVTGELEQVDLRALTTGAPIRPTIGPGNAPRKPLLASLDNALVGVAVAAPAPYDSGSPATTGELGADTIRVGLVQTSHVQSKLRASSGEVLLEGLRFDAYDGHVDGAVTFDLRGASARFRAGCQLSGLDMAKLVAAIPEGEGKITGKAEGNFNISGEVSSFEAALASLVGTGQVTIRNGRLPTLRFDENLIQLARVGGLGPGSRDPAAFSLFAADLNIAGERITSRKITIVGNGITIEGAGTLDVASADSLNYRGTAKIAAKRNALTTVIAGLSGATYAHGQLVFPFALSGDVRNPRFVLTTAPAGKP